MRTSHIQKIVEVRPQSNITSSRLSSGQKKSRIFKYRNSPSPSPVHSQIKTENSSSKIKMQQNPNTLNLYDARSIKSEEFRNSCISMNGNSNLSYIQSLNTADYNHKPVWGSYVDNRDRFQASGVQNRQLASNSRTPVKFNYQSPSPGNSGGPRVVYVKNNYSRITAYVPEGNQIPQPITPAPQIHVITPPLATQTRNSYIHVERTPPKVIYSSGFSPLPTNGPIEQDNVAVSPSPLVANDNRVARTVYSPRAATESATIPQYVPAYAPPAQKVPSVQPYPCELMPIQIRRQSQLENTAINLLEPLRADITQYMSSNAAKNSVAYIQPGTNNFSLYRQPRIRTSEASRGQYQVEQPLVRPSQPRNQKYADLQTLEQQIQYYRRNSPARAPQIKVQEYKQPVRRGTESDLTLTRNLVSNTVTNIDLGNPPPIKRYSDANVKIAPLKKLDTLGTAVEEIVMKKKAPQPMYETWVMSKDSKEQMQGSLKLKSSQKSPSFKDSLNNPFPTFASIGSKARNPSPPILPSQNEMEESISLLNISEIKESKQLNNSNSGFEVPSPTISASRSPAFTASSIDSPMFAASSPTPLPPTAASVAETTYLGWTLQNLIIVVVLIGLGLGMITLQVVKD